MAGTDYKKRLKAPEIEEKARPTSYIKFSGKSPMCMD